MPKVAFIGAGSTVSTEPRAVGALPRHLAALIELTLDEIAELVDALTEAHGDLIGPLR